MVDFPNLIIDHESMWTGFAHIKLVKKGKSRMTAKRYTILVSSTRKIVLAIAQWSLINAGKIPFIGLYLLEF